MPEKDPRHLLDKLAEIEDPRNEKGKRHPLNSILGLVQALGFTHKTSPCPTTIHNGISRFELEKS